MGLDHSARVVYLVIFLGVGLLLLSLGPFLRVCGVGIDVSYSIAIALALGLSVVTAGCGVLSTAHPLLRIVLSVVGAFVCWFSVYTAFSIRSGSSTEAYVFSAVPLGTFILACIPLVLLRLLIGWRISFTDLRSIHVQQQIQFGIRHLLITTAIFSILMGIVRLLVIPAQEMLAREMTGFAVYLAL